MVTLLYRVTIFMKLKDIFFILFLCVVLIYVTNLTSISKRIILFEGENLNLGTIFGVCQKKKKL